MAKYSTQIRLSVTLFIITFLVAALLAVVNNITTSKKGESEKNAITDALTSIFPGETFTEKELSGAMTATGVKSVYQAGDKGFVVDLNTKGYGGNINLLVGLDSSGAITEVQVISSNETPGIGTKVLNAEYLSVYKGLSGTLSFSDKLSPVSGATISSKAVLDGVNKAIEAVKEANGNG